MAGATLVPLGNCVGNLFEVDNQAHGSEGEFVMMFGMFVFKLILIIKIDMAGNKSLFQGPRYSKLDA